MAGVLVRGHRAVLRTCPHDFDPRAIWQQWVRVGPAEAARGVVPAGASGRLVRGAGKELNVPATRGGAESVIR